MEVMESAKSKTQRTSDLFNPAQDLTLRTLFSGAYVSWLDSLDGRRWYSILPPSSLSLFRTTITRSLLAHSLLLASG